MLAVIAGTAAAQEVTFSSDRYRVTEGNAATPELVLSHARSEDVTVHVEVLGRNSGADFAPGPWQVTVPAGQTRQGFSITTFDDGKVGRDREFLLHVSPYGHSDGVTRGKSRKVETGTPGVFVTYAPDATLTIADRTTRISIPRFTTIPRTNTIKVREGGTATVRVAIENPKPAAFTLEYTLSGGSGGYYAEAEDVVGGFGTRSVTVPANAGHMDISIETVQDRLHSEGDETFGVVLSTSEPGVTGTPAFSVRILDDDPTPGTAISFSRGSKSVGEDAGTYHARLDLTPPPTKSITVRYDVIDEGATSGSDYHPPSGTLTVPAGAATATIPVTIVDDDEQEGSQDAERFRLVLAYGYDYRLGNDRHLVTILDNEELPVVSFSKRGTDVEEGAGTQDVTLNLSPAPNRDIVVTYQVRPSVWSHLPTATSGSDFEALSGRVAVSAGATTATIPVTVIDDGAHESRTEVVRLLLRSGEGYTTVDSSWRSFGSHYVRFSDNDPRIDVSFASASQGVVEGAGTRDVTVNLYPAPTADITLGYSVGGTATAGSDYTALQGTLEVPAGATTATIPVAILDDGDQEGAETVVLTLTGTEGHRKASPGTHTLTIAASDGAPSMTRASFATASQSVSGETGTHDVTVNLYPPSASNVTLNYTVGGSATPGSDYTALQATLAVPAGAVTATIPVTLLADSVQEDRETVVLTLAPGTGYELASPGTHTLTFGTVPTVTFPLPLVVTSESVGVYQAPVHLSPPPHASITIIYASNPFTATPGEDYEAPSGTLTVPAGATKAYIPITIIDDSVEDSGEVLSLWLLDRNSKVDTGVEPPPGYTVGRFPNMQVGILNHEVGDLEASVQARLDAAVVDGDGAAADLWRRALAAVRGEAPPNGLARLTQADAEAQASLHAGQGETELASLWSSIAEILGIDVTDPAGPEITIGADAASVMEGGSASFTLTADPVPSAPLDVTVAVAATGDFGITAGERTVTIPATGSVSLTLATTGDDVDETDGSVTATVNAGTGYTVGAASSDTVAIEDDDASAPEVTVTADAASVTEGGSAGFTLTADPAPSAPLDVTVTVAATGDFGIAAGTQAVTIPTNGSVTLTLATTGDDVDEADGSVSVTVDTGAGYTVGTPSSGTVAIADDDMPEVTIAADATSVTEGGSATFTLTADPAPSAPLDVTVTIAATGDYGIADATQTVTIPTTGSATLTLATAGDDADEADGSVSVTVDAGTGYTVGSDSTGTVAIADDDDPPAAAAHPVVKYAPLVKSFYDRITARHGHGDSASGGWNKRFLKAMGHAEYVNYPQAAVTVADATRIWNSGGNAAWDGTVEAVTYAEKYFAGQVTTPTPDPTPTPEVTIAAGAGVTEGTDATFTLTADPAPAASLDVTVTIDATGDYGIADATQTVTIPTTGSVTLTLATTGDGADEADGSVSVTVDAGTGYTVGSASTGTVAIADDDDPAPPVGELPAGHPVVQYADLIHKIEAWLNDRDPDVNCTSPCKAKWSRVLKALGVPEYQDITGSAFSASQADANEARGWSMWQGVGDAIRYAEQYFAGQVTPPDPVSVPAVSIAAGADVTEGGSASFVLTATPAPSAPLDVSVTIAATGDYGIADATQTVTIPTTGSYTLTLATTGDDADEADGSVSATVDAGTGYTVGSASSGTVAIADDDVPTPANAAPAVANAIPDQAATAGTAFSFQVAANAFTDANGDSLTHSATRADGSALPSWLAFDAGARTFSGTPAAGDAGTLTVRVTADDGRGGSVFDDFDLTVSAPTPAVSIAAGSGVTEGGSASFVLTATPAPAAPLDVTVAIAASGDYGIADATQTVTIPTTGSFTLTLATDNDGADEADGSVTATVDAGTGYTVGTPSTGTVAIADDDVPAIAIAAGADVTEGGDATFTLSADPVPHAPLAVTVALTAEGAYGVTAGERTVTMPVSGTATLTVATTGDDADEPDGSVTATVNAGTGYAVGSASTASVAVRDDDEPVIAAGPSVLTLVARDLNGDGPGHVTEGGTAEVEVRLNPAPAKHVSLYYRTLAGTAWTHHDFRLIRPTRMQFRPGETVKTIRVRTVNDAHDEGLEEFSVRVWPASADVTPKGGVIVTVTITNDDPMPAAYLARFGRTVAEQALDGIAGRMAASRAPGMQGSIAGQSLNFDPSASGQPATGESTMIGATPGASGIPPANRGAALAMADVARGFGASAPAGSGGMAGSFGDRFGAPSPRSRGMTAGEALLGSSFSLTGQDGAGGSLAFWGRASQGSFDGAERGDGTDITLDGTVTTGMLGADYARGNWLIGLALTQSTADGGYAAMGEYVAGSELGCPPDGQGQPQVLCDGAVRAGDGDVEASLTAAIPYAALRVSERLKLWGAAGYGSGEVTLKTMEENYSADTSWTMAAAGVRGDLLVPPEDGGSGPGLALTSDGLWAETSSEKTRDLAASDSSVTRLRLGLEGSWRMALEGGGSLTPKLEVGARHDGGDAETGSGVEVGGGVAWVDSGRGLSLDVSGRTLLAHENDDLEDRGFAAALSWDPRPATRRGLSLSLRQEFGGQATGGLDALFAPAPLEDRSGSAAASRWAMEAAYGLPAFGGRFVGSPHAGLGLSTGARDWSIGWRLTPEAATAPDLSFGLRATRRENDAADPEHTVGAEAILRW